MGWDPNAPMLNCQEWSDMVEQHAAELKAQHNATVEKCARELEDKFLNDDPNFVKAMADAIRALKDK